METLPVAVTGIGLVCAAGRDTDEVWKAVLDGRTALRPVDTAARPEFAPFGDPVAGAVDDRWLVEPAAAEPVSRDVRMAVTAATEAIRMSGLDGPRLRGAGLVLGKCQPLTGPTGSSHAWIHATADAVARQLSLAGPRYTIATACAAGGNAVGAAADRLWAGDAEVMLAGGVDLLLPQTYAGFAALRSIDPRPCAPYSRSGGLNLGEGAAFLLLEPLAAARARGATVLAEVLGHGLSADAHHATAPDPTGRGAILAVRRALDDAGLGPERVTYVNGHGTGTKANDTVENRVMRTLFGDRADAVPITSTKSFAGHSLGASGAVEAVVSVLSVRHDVIPPTVNVEGEPPPGLDIVPEAARPAAVRVVVSNNYAFGGNNVSLVLAKPGTTRRRTLPTPDEPPVITGVGLVTNVGLGRDALTGLLRADGAAPTGHDADPLALLRTRTFAPMNAWRQMNSFTRLAMAATRLAVEDAGLPLGRAEREHTGLLLGSQSGPAVSQLHFDATALQRPNANEFAQIVLNAPAGAVCQVLGVRGPTTTVVSGGASGTLALATALDLLRLGRASAVVVLAVEERCSAVDQSYEAVGLLPAGRRTGTAAVGLVVEEAAAARARGAAGRCRLLEVHHRTDARHPFRHDPAGSRYREVIEDSLARCGAGPAGVSHFFGCAGGTDLDEAERNAAAAVPHARRYAFKDHTGECEAASGLLNVAAAAEVLAAGPAGALAVAAGVSFGATYGSAVLGAAA